MSNSRRAKHRRALVWSVLAGVVGLYFCVRWATAVVVTTSTISEATSPGGAWKATVDEIVTEGLVANVFIANVRLVSTRDPAEIAKLLGVDTGGNAEERPRIAWTGSDRLHITVPGAAKLVTVSERHYRNVRVDVSFEPVDPVLPAGSR